MCLLRIRRMRSKRVREVFIGICLAIPVLTCGLHAVAEHRQSLLDRELFKAITQGNADHVRIRLDEGANPNACYRDELDHPSLIDRAMALVGNSIGRCGTRSANELWDGNSALLYATKCSNTDLVKLLCERGARVNERPGTCASLNYLTRYCTDPKDLEIARILLDRGAAADGKNAYGEAYLDTSKREGNKELASLIARYTRAGTVQ
jgi:hypothetical protein